MIVLDLSILNQKGTPMFNSDTFANRPNFGIVGRIFISTDTKEFFRDTGTSWELIGGPGSGTITGSGAAGQVTYFTGATSIGGNSNFLFDSATGFLELYTQDVDTFQIGRKSTITQFSQQNGILFGSYVSGVFRDTSEIRSYYTGNGSQRSGKLVIATRNTSGSISAINFGENGQIYSFSGNIPNTYPSKLFIGGTGTTASTYTAQFHNNTGTNNALVIDDAGSVMLGTSTSTGQRLQVNGDALINFVNQYTAITSGDGLFLKCPSTSANGVIGLTGAGMILQGRDGTTNPFAVILQPYGENVLIGTTVNTGYKVQITSSTADNQLNVWGASAPSIRIDNAGSAATQRFVIGLATATNNFIQGSAAGQFCISTQSSGAMLFGMWQTVNATEAMRISTANNLIVGSSADNGNRFQVFGTSSFTGQSIFNNQVYANKILNSATISNSPGDASLLLYAPTTTNYYGGIIGWAEGNIAASISAYDDGSGGALGLSFATGNNTSISERLKISSTGTATFSSSVNIGNTVSTAVAAPSTHKVAILIGGVQYYLLASDV
jgi:hypothetical protein